MKNAARALMIIVVSAALLFPVSAGELSLIDRAVTMTAVAPSAAVLDAGMRGGLFLIAEGKVYPYQWAQPVFDAGPPFGEGIARAIPAEINADDRWLLTLADDGRTGQLWRCGGDCSSWTRVNEFSFDYKVVELAAGKFSSNGEAGLFVQYDNGRRGYWRLKATGPVPFWQSPESWPAAAVAKSGDFNGDGLDELVVVTTDGSLSILRWNKGLWEEAWSLPSWGQVLGLDVAPADTAPGLEIALVTSHRRLILIGYSGGAFAVRAALTTQIVAGQVALVPAGGGAVVLEDARGGLYLFTPVKETMRQEAYFGGGDRLSFLAGLDEGRIMAVTGAGSLQVIQTTLLNRTTVFYDGKEVKNTGLYWDNGEFYFSPDFLKRALDVDGRWDAGKKKLTLTLGRLSVILEAGETKITVNGRPWSLTKVLIVAGNKTPYVPAELLRAVFLVNVTYDPMANWLILTSASPAG